MWFMKAPRMFFDSGRERVGAQLALQSFEKESVTFAHRGKKPAALPIYGPRDQEGLRGSDLREEAGRSLALWAVNRHPQCDLD